MNRAPGFPDPGAHPASASPGQPRQNPAAPTQGYAPQPGYNFQYPPQDQAASGYAPAMHDPQQGWAEDPNARWAPQPAQPAPYGHGQAAHMPGAASQPAHQHPHHTYQPPQYHMPQPAPVAAHSIDAQLQRSRAAAQAAQAAQPAFNPFGQQGYGGRPAGPVAAEPSPHALGYGNEGAALRGSTFDQWPAPAAPAPAFDPRYQNAPYRVDSPNDAYDPAYRQPGHDPAWDYASGAQGGMAASEFDTSGLGPGQHYEQPVDGDGYAYDQGPEFEVEEPRRRFRPALIAAGLFGAIVVGAGATYFLSGSDAPSTSKTAQVVTSPKEPIRTKPTDPGGRQFEHSDSKIMGRLGESASRSATSDEGGTRKVTTLVVGRDGSIGPPAAQPPAMPPPAVSVPGMTIVDGLGGGGPRPGTAPPRPSAAPADVATASPAPSTNPPPAAAKPSQLDPRVRPAGASESSAPTPDADEPIVVNAPPATGKKPVVVAKANPAPARITTSAVPEDDQELPAAPPKKTKRAATAAAAPSASSGGGGAGWVAVLASVPASGSSRMDALKRFADMQQQYGDVLQNTTPDVQEASVPDKGTYHRLVAGPPGSRDQANQLCSRLKGAGYESCWIKQY